MGKNVKMGPEDLHRRCIDFIRSEKQHDYCNDEETLWFLWRRKRTEEMSRQTFKMLYEYEASGGPTSEYRLSFLRRLGIYLVGDSDPSSSSLCTCPHC